MRFLRHIIDGDGVAVDPEKVEVIVEMSKRDLMDCDGCTPSVHRVKSFLRIVFYYQHFIPLCSYIAKLLFAGQKRRGKIYQNPSVFRKLKPSDWTDDFDAAFFSLKEKLLNCAVLTHPDFSKPLILSIDASLDGLGAVLSQIPEGGTKARPIAFASKTLTGSQKRYPAHRLEFLVLKWSVCEKFKHWLKGQSFTVWTDNNPLTKLKLDACEQRWVTKLSLYTFSLKHIPGPKNVVMDALSRDPFTTSVSQRLISEPPSRQERSKLALIAQTLCKQWHQLKVLDGVLYRVMKDPSTRQKFHFQFVLPLSLKAKALSVVHDLAGHQGQARSVHPARQRFFWPQMERDIKE